jgi:hypothetical protein
LISILLVEVQIIFDKHLTGTEIELRPLPGDNHYRPVDLLVHKPLHLLRRDARHAPVII